MPERNLANAVVAVVGASGGLGRPLVEALVDHGAVPVVAGRDRTRLGTVDPSTLTVELDIRDPASGDTLVAAVTERHGRLDGLVVASGVVAFGDLVDTDDETIEELFLTNVLGPLWLLKRAIPLLATSSGFVCHLSAVVADAPLPGMAAYAASKGALTVADRALARELRRRKIAVIDARPPHTETGLASRPIAGTAPRLGEGRAPEAVATRIVAAIRAGEAEVPAAAF